MSNFSEKSLVEDYIIKQLQDKGWHLVPADELERESFEEPLLINNLIRAIQRINKELNVGDEEISKVLNELNLVVSGQEGAKRILNFYKFGVPIKFEKERVIKYVQLFDFSAGEILNQVQNDNIKDEIASPLDKLGARNDAWVSNNEFLVTKQVNYSGKEKIRTDIMLYVNGIPLINIECKDPTKPGGTWFDAYKQIKDYENIVPELYKYVQIGVAAEARAKYFPIASWQDDVKKYEWREGIKDSIDATIEMLKPQKLLDIVKNFFFSRIEYGNATKVITRYMQYRAANKIVNRVLGNLAGEEDKNKGLIWHWQGSGKTLTMIFAAHKLYYNSILENPTIFFIVDRIELEEQLYTEFYSLDILRPEIIGSVDELQKVLSYDSYRGKRGIFITLIHKFRKEELNVLQKYLEKVSQDKTTIMNRQNVIAFVDEGHRTQYGLLAAQMNAILRNAFFFAMTGTPISKPKHGRDTYEQFAYLPEEPYLDRYFILESIKDGFTTKIVYQPRLEELHLKKDMLETFLEVELDEIPEFARTEVEAKTKARLNPINVFLENQTRIAQIAQDIAQHFKENVDGKFKAMIVAASRKACVYYKNELAKHLPKSYYDVVMTSERSDNEIIYGYVREAREKYDGKDYKSTLKEIIDKYKKDDFPKILIVTDMLLTGFDVPQLQVMYLDKPLKEHRLLQAIARTNRPYGDEKEAGIIIDYVGILKEFKRALEIYCKDDKADFANALNDYDSIKQEFKSLIDEISGIFGSLTQNYERSTLLKALEILTTDVQNEEQFVDKYRNLRRLFELLGPDIQKLKYFDIYKWISAIYTYYMKTVMRKASVDAYVQKFYEKTVKFVYKTTDVEKIDKELPIIAFDEEYLGKLEEKIKSKKEKAANMLFTLQRFVLVEKYKDPIYESLADHVERMIKYWAEKTKDYERIYKEGVKVVENINTLRERQRKLGFDKLEYAMLLNLETQFGEGKILIDEVKILRSELDKHMFPGWLKQVTVRKAIERTVRRFVRKFKSKHDMTLKDIDALYNKLIESVKNYGA